MSDPYVGRLVKDFGTADDLVNSVLNDEKSKASIHTTSIVRPAREAETVITLRDRPNGVPTITDDGKPIRYVGSVILTVANGVLTDTANAGSAGYSEVEHASPITNIGTDFKIFDNGQGASGGVTLALWANSRVDTWPSVPRTNCHFVVTSTTWGFGIWPSDGASEQVVLKTGAFRVPLAFGVSHTVELAFDLNRETVYIMLPDGTTATVTDSRIRTLAGRFACWESYYATIGSQNKLGYHRMWASSDPDAGVSRSAVARVSQSLPGQPREIARQSAAVANITVPSGTGSSQATEVATDLRIRFIVPESGSVVQSLTAIIRNPTAGALYLPIMGLYTWEGVAIREPAMLGASGPVAEMPTVFEYLHNGLTPGQRLEARVRHYCNTASDAVITASATRKILHKIKPVIPGSA